MRRRADVEADVEAELPDEVFDPRSLGLPVPRRWKPGDPFRGGTFSRGADGVMRPVAGEDVK